VRVIEWIALRPDNDGRRGALAWILRTLDVAARPDDPDAAVVGPESLRQELTAGNYGIGRLETSDHALGIVEDVRIVSVEGTQIAGIKTWNVQRVPTLLEEEDGSGLASNDGSTRFQAEPVGNDQGPPAEFSQFDCNRAGSEITGCAGVHLSGKKDDGALRSKASLGKPLGADICSSRE